MGDKRTGKMTMNSWKWLSFLLLSVYVMPANGANKVLKIWNGPAPGTESRKDSEIWEKARIVSGVYQPDLTVYLPQKPDSNHSAIVIFPGGGFRRIMMEKEGYKIAHWLNEQGVVAFVLKYRLDPGEALQDAQRSVSFVRAHASEFGIDADKIGVIGFSAGGFVVGNLVTHTERDIKRDNIDSTSCRPDFAIGVYGAYEPRNGNELFVAFSKLVDKNTPPFFLVHALNDMVVPAQQSVNLFTALRQAGVPVELHLYETGGHGFALEADRGVVISWANLLLDWLRERKALQ